MSIYEIRVKGHLDQQWSAWFDGVAISSDSDILPRYVTSLMGRAGHLDPVPVLEDSNQ